MEAILCKQWGNPEVLVFDSVKLAPLKTHEVKIKVTTVGLQLTDILMIQGRYQAKPPFPFIPGGEVSGEVIEVGEQVGGLQVGDKVLAFCETGGLAEYIQTSWRNVVFIPDYIEGKTAVALGVTYTTAYLGLVQRAKVQPSQKLLVMGATGSMGLAAVGIGSFLGAEVIAVGSTLERLAEAEQAGATYFIPYQEEDFKQTLKEIVGRKGLNTVYDPVGGDLFDQMLSCLGWESHIISANRLLLHNATLSGLYLNGYKQAQPDKIKTAFQTLIHWYQEGNIKPLVSEVFSFEEAQKALELVMDKQNIGKVIVNFK
jgi:NADPH2:quinone reductase